MVGLQVPNTKITITIKHHIVFLNDFQHCDIIRAKLHRENLNVKLVKITLVTSYKFENYSTFPILVILKHFKVYCLV